LRIANDTDPIRCSFAMEWNPPSSSTGRSESRK
jgi:hypothetical protein